jgi:integrase
MWAGVEKMLSVGVYPQTSLSHARARTQEARTTLGGGKDPGAQRSAVKENTEGRFDAVARHFLAQIEKHVKADKRAFVTYRKAHWIIEKLLIPELGSRVLDEITPKDLLKVLKDIETNCQFETARRARQRAGQIFRHGIGLGHASRDITVDLKGLLAAPLVSHHASLIDPAEVKDSCGQSTNTPAILKRAPP